MNKSINEIICILTKWILFRRSNHSYWNTYLKLPFNNKFDKPVLKKSKDENGTNLQFFFRKQSIFEIMKYCIYFNIFWVYKWTPIIRKNFRSPFIPEELSFIAKGFSKSLGICALGVYFQINVIAWRKHPNSYPEQGMSNRMMHHSCTGC